MSEGPVSPPKGGGNAFKSAFTAKVKGVPILLIGVPVVIVGAMLFRKPADATTDGDSQETSGQPVFLAKQPPSNWLALDPQSGIAYNADGTEAYYKAGEEPPVTTATPSTPAVTDPPAPPVTTLSAHQMHVAHLAHVARTSPVGSKPKTSLPKPTTVRVAKGDTLTAIAKRNNTTVSSLVKLNNIKNANLIRAGETLRVR